MMKKLKICDIVRNSVWHDPRVTKQLREYERLDYEVHFVGNEDSLINSDEINKISGHPHIVMINKIFKRYRNKFNTLLKEISLYRGLIKEIRKVNPDIIHANDLDALFAAYIANLSRKAIIIYDTHEIFVENYRIYSSFIKRNFWSSVENYIIKRVNIVVCVSNAAADYIAQKYNIKRPIVVTNCSYKSHFKDEVNKSDKFEVLNHGKFYEGRGYDLMVDAAKISDNSNVRFVLRGFGPMKKLLCEEVEKYALDNVKFADPVKVTELVNSARLSHVGVAITIPFCLNFKLSVSNKIFEYVAAGLPVIMSDIPEHRYLNDRYDFGLILKENTPQELYKCVMELYSDKNLYLRLSANAIKMSDEINWEKEFNKLLVQINQLIS